jgi:hypothetical protein
VRTDILNPAPNSAMDFESSEMIGVVEGDHRGKQKHTSFGLLLRKMLAILAYLSSCPGCSPLVPDADFYPSRIPDLVSRIGKGEKCFVYTFFVASDITNLKLI